MGKIASTLLTFLFSIPITAVGFMAIFGIPEIAPLNASPSDEIVIRDPYDQDPWGQQAENSQQLGTAQEFPQFSTQQNQAPQQGNEAPAWGLDVPAQSQQQNRSQGSGNQNPFRHQVTGHSIQSQPAANPPNHLGENTNSNLVINHQPNTPATMAANQAPVRTENPFANTGTIGNHPNTTETSAQMLTWAEASARLTELGIKYHLERGDREGSFLFVCLYRPQSNPQVMHRFEAEENDPILAVNKAIGQVENWLQEQYRLTNSATASRF